MKEDVFYAFYTSLERNDGSPGKACIALDAIWMLSALSGPYITGD
jgi:hypothetical protein